ncbi:MAG: dihydrodipicolinate synthase family protein [Bryobacteraceae bacterium]
MTRFEGIYPATLTPFDANGNFDAAVYERFICHLYDQGSSGQFVCGVMGEGLLMTAGERETVAETAIRVSRGKGKVLVHVGSGSTAESVRLARHAVRAGADGVSSLAPHSAPFGPAAIESHFRAIAEAAQPLPFLIYYNPAAAPCLNSYAVLERLLDLPGIAGVKFSGINAEDLAYVILQRAQRQNVLTGVDEMLLATQMMGAHGAIAALANVMPRLFVEVRRLAREGNPRDALPLQRRVIEVARLLEPYPFMAAVKALSSRDGMDLGNPRPPHLPLTEDQRTELLAGFARIAG